MFNRGVVGASIVSWCLRAMNRLLLFICTCSISSTSAFIALPAASVSRARIAQRVVSSRGPLLHAAALAEDLDLKSWCEAAGITADKIDVDSATVTQDVAALEVLARVPRSLTLSAARRKDWPGKLTAAAIEAVEEGGDLGSYVRSWRGGGWATSSDDLEARDQETVDSLLATGSDNDFEIFKKFGMKCVRPVPLPHPSRRRGRSFTRRPPGRRPRRLPAKQPMPPPQ